MCSWCRWENPSFVNAYVALRPVDVCFHPHQEHMKYAYIHIFSVSFFPGKYVWLVNYKCCHILHRVGLPETRVFYEGLHTQDSRNTCYVQRLMSIHQFRINTSGHMTTRSTSAALAVIIDPGYTCI